jgi:hypothetical protein
MTQKKKPQEPFLHPREEAFSKHATKDFSKKFFALIISQWA